MPRIELGDGAAVRVGRPDRPAVAGDERAASRPARAAARAASSRAAAFERLARDGSASGRRLRREVGGVRDPECVLGDREIDWTLCARRKLGLASVAVDLRDGAVADVPDPERSVPRGNRARVVADDDVVDDPVRLRRQRPRPSCARPGPPPSRATGEGRSLPRRARAMLPQRGLRLGPATPGERARRRRATFGAGEGAASAGSWRRIARWSSRSSGVGSIAEVGVERRARVRVDLERVALATGPVERDHQLPAKAFSVRVLLDERFELGDERRVAPAVEVGVDSGLDRGQAELVETARSPPGRTARTRSPRAPARATARARRGRCSRPVLRSPHAPAAPLPRRDRETGASRSRPARRRGDSRRARTESLLPRRSSDASAFRSRETYAWSVLSAESGGSSGHSSSISRPTGHDLARDGERESPATRAAFRPRAISSCSVVDDVERAEEPDLHASLLQGRRACLQGILKAKSATCKRACAISRRP